MARPSEVQHSAVNSKGSERCSRPIDFEMRAKQKSEFPAPEFLLEIEDGEIDSVFFIKIGKNQLRERLVTVFSLKCQAERINITLVESSPLQMKLYLPSNDDESDLQETSNCTASDFILRPEPKVENVSHLIQSVFKLS